MLNLSQIVTNVKGPSVSSDASHASTHEERSMRRPEGRRAAAVSGAAGELCQGGGPIHRSGQQNLHASWGTSAGCVGPRSDECASASSPRTVCGSASSCCPRDSTQLSCRSTGQRQCGKRLESWVSTVVGSS